MIDHALDPVRFAELEVHIDGCAQCRQVIAAVAVSRTVAIGTGEGRAVGTPGGGSGERAVADSIDGRFVIESQLGAGGMGTVYLARALTLVREVALKVHRAGSGNDRLQREAVAMAKLAHPNVVTVFEVATIDDRLYVAME